MVEVIGTVTIMVERREVDVVRGGRRIRGVMMMVTGMIRMRMKKGRKRNKIMNSNF